MILEMIEAASEKAGIKNTYYADIREFNAFQNSFSILDFPANVIVPINESGNNVGNRTKNVFQIQGWVLVKIPKDGNLIKIREAEQFLEPCRKQARSFVNALGYSKHIDPEVNNIVYTIKPEYHFTSSLLFGVSYTINLPLTFKPC